MKRALLVFFIAVNLCAAAQDNVIIRGFVFDKDNKQPLSLAAVQVKNSALGALTDDYGFFELPVPKTNLTDSLRVSYIGYVPQAFYIKNFKQGDTLKVLLGLQTVIKEDFVVTAVSAKGILLHAIENLRKNFYRDSIIETGFYRQTHKENGKYVRLIEADVSVAFNVINPYLYSFHELVQVNKQRRSENYETNGDTHGDHFVDLLKENPFSYNKSTFLNPKMLDFFSPKIESEDSGQYVLKTQYKESSSAKLEQAKIWVEKETYAITKIEVEKFPNPYYLKPRYAHDSRWKLVNEKDVILLQQYKGKFVVSSIQRVYNHHVLNLQTGNVDYIVEESFNLYFDEYDGSDVGQQIKNGKYNTFTSLYTAAYNYDEKYWKDYDLSGERKLPAQVKTDLEHAQSLEKQFKEMGK